MAPVPLIPCALHPWVTMPIALKGSLVARGRIKGRKVRLV